MATVDNKSGIETMIPLDAICYHYYLTQRKGQSQNGCREKVSR